MTIKAVIFDMDGIIVDTEEWYQQRRYNFLKSLGYDLDLDWREFIGETFASLWGKISPQIDLPLTEVEEKYQIYKKEHQIDYKDILVPGVATVIKELKQLGYLLAVASSSTMVDIKRCLEENNLTDYFAVLNSARDLGEPKPSALVYKKTLADLNLTPNEVIVIEDSKAGITSAKKAKLTVIAYFDEKYNQDQKQADYQITQMEQLIDILEKKKK